MASARLNRKKLYAKGSCLEIFNLKSDLGKKT